MYHYAGNNPVRYIDPDGNAVHILVGAGIGAAVGLGNQIINDALSGDVSPMSDYVGSIAGGATTGAVLAATGNGALAGAAGGLVQNIAKTGTEIISKEVNGEEIDMRQTGKEFLVNTAKDVAIGTAVGAVCSIKGGIPGVNSGKGAMSAVANATMTKLKNGTISNVSVKTSAKIAASRCVEGALVSGTALGDLINIFASKFTNKILENKSAQTKQDNFSEVNINECGRE